MAHRHIGFRVLAPAPEGQMATAAIGEGKEAEREPASRNEKVGASGRASGSPGSGEVWE